MRRASDTAIAAAIARHTAAHAAVLAHVAGQADIDDRDPAFRRLEQAELKALRSLVSLTPATIAGVRAVSRHVCRFAPREDWRDNLAEKLLRTFAR